MIYRYIPNSNAWASLETPRSARAQIEKLFGNCNVGDWQTPILNIDMTRGDLPDFPSLIQPVPVASAKAWQIIEKQFSPHLSGLPVKLTGVDEPFYIIDIPVISCLDRHASELRISKVDGSISKVKTYAFDQEPEDSIGLFKIPETNGLEVLATMSFLQLVESFELTGLVLKPIPVV